MIFKVGVNKVGTPIHFQIFEIPLLMSQQVSLIHKDAVFQEKIKFSTFTLSKSDIFFMTSTQAHIIDKYSRPQKIFVEEEV